MNEEGNKTFELEYEVDTNNPEENCVKFSTPRRLITELFTLNLRFMDEFFDTYPLYLDSHVLLNTLKKIFLEEEPVHFEDPKHIYQHSFINRCSNLQTNKNQHDSKLLSNWLSDGEKISESSEFVYSPNDIGEHAYSLYERKDSSLKQESMYQTVHKSCMSQKKDISDNYDTMSVKMGMSGQSVDSFSSNNTSISIQLKVLKILSNWMAKFYIDFYKDEELKKSLLLLIENIIEFEKDGIKKSSTLTRATMLRNTLLEMDKKNEQVSITNQDSMFNTTSNQMVGTIREKDMPMNKQEPEMVAYGFTQLAIQLQKKINIRELLNIAWTKENRHTLAPSIIRITEFFNRISQLVKIDILSHPKTSKRAKILEFWIFVAIELQQIHNYGVIAMIMAALDSNQIYRLNKTWSKISKKAKGNMEDLRKLVSPISNYSGFRNKYKGENFIPFLGPILTDLVYTEERIRTEAPDGRINFKKMRTISKLISVVRKSINYNLKSSHHQGAVVIVQRFCNGETMDEDDISKLSFEVEKDDSEY